MSIDIDKERLAFRAWLDTLTADDLRGGWLEVWLAAKRHAAEVAAPVEIAQRSDCRMTGGICSCRSGGSYGGCRKERDACCSTFAPATPSGASVDGDARTKTHKLFLECMKQIGLSDGAPGWIEHADEDGPLRRDSLTLEGEIILGFDHIYSEMQQLGRSAARWEYIEDHASIHGGGNGFTISCFIPFDEEDMGVGVDRAIAAMSPNKEG